MILENEFIALTISNHAAQMHSLIDKADNAEILWQGDPDFWAGRNPILFPIVGSTFDQQIHLFDQIYTMGNHGFTRNSDFTLIHQTSTSLTLRLSESDETLAQYPFRFDLDVTYTLLGSKVQIDYRITNNDTKPMPFSFGLHPAFALDDPDQAHIEFPATERNGNETVPSIVKMDDAFFSSVPTFMLEYPNSPYVDLIRGSKRIRVSCVGYRWLAFWKKPKARFLCIEPWHGHGDFEPVSTDFYRREGTLVLEPGKIYRTSYFIELL